MLPARATIAIACAQLWFGLLWFFYWGHGVARAAIVVAMLGGLCILRWGLRFPEERSEATARPPRLLVWAVFFAIALNCVLAIVTDTRAWHTGRIPMDEGRTSWRAARLLWLGKNPYARGAIADFVAYKKRAAIRQEIGLGAARPRAVMDRELKAYDRELDPALRRKLLPVPARATGPQLRETSVTGYKYGPIILGFTALTSPFGEPAAVLMLNAAFCFGLYLILWRILREIAGGDTTLALVAILALLLDRHITRDYIDRSATDVYALFFCAIGVLAWLKGRLNYVALALACSVGCKIFPGLALVPLLLTRRTISPLLVFCAAALAIYLPWILWDPAGIFYNVLRWPMLMGATDSSWQFYVPPGAALAIRALVAGLIVAVWLAFLLGRDKRLFWTLAVSNTLLLLLGATFSNNYVPWASIWIVLSIVETAVWARERDVPVTLSTLAVSAIGPPTPVSP